jgi:putative Ca2+/H+ antiporter (TMEM165/GDT1 family)
MNASPFIAAFAAVFFAEMIGDRSLYTISSLASSFGTARVAAGVSVAFAMKMAVAVLLGRQMAQLSPSVVAAVSATTFFATAVVLYRKGRRRSALVSRGDAPFVRASTVSFAAIFFTEWADVGQITAAMLVARFGAPLLVWSGATAAMMSKGIVALAIAAGLRNRLKPEWLQYGACATCIVLGCLAVFRIA